MTHPLTFGKYLLLDRINVGGMAEVFKAKAFGIEGFERIIAIKRILPNMIDDDEFIKMFVDEARIAVKLSHANIVQIYELGKFENQYYIAMEYVSGKDLRQILDRYRKKKITLPVSAAAYICSKICEGLDYAHRKIDPTGRPMNVIHRDVSPQNILVSYEGAVKVTDFGIAKAEDRASKTQAGVLKGKFGYMSPEQVRGLDIDHRSDIFAVGILFYEMVCGKRLFIGESDFSTLERVRKAEVVPPTEHNPDLAPELEAVVMRALARERDERYQWASELHDDLQQFLIENTTIYNAKRLSTLLREDYQTDIDAEMQRMEEYMRLARPSNLDLSSAAQAPQGKPSSAGPPKPGERTMIFESDFGDLENAPTQIGESVSEAGQPMSIEQMQTGSLVVKSNSAKAKELAEARSNAQAKLDGAARGKQKRGVPVAGLVIAAGVLLSLLVAAVVWLVIGSSRGSLMVTTYPATENIEILLNNEVVSTTSPYFGEDLDEGTYRLEARAPGFKSKVYSVEIGPELPAEVNVRFDEAVPSDDGVAIITSMPVGAAVLMGGQEVGKTPLTLDSLNTDGSVEVELRLAGYEDRTLRGDFEAGKKRLELDAVLKAVEAAGASLNVVSDPPGATLYLDDRKIGVTPFKIEGLDPSKPVKLSLSKSGYEVRGKQFTFNGEMNDEVQIDLKPIKIAEPRTPPKKTPRKSEGGSGSAGGGGGRCKGSDGEYSVMVLGEPNCSVRIGATTYKSPVFKKQVPTGNCTVSIQCPSGKTYSTRKKLKSGDNGKLIVKPDMLN